MMASGQGVAPVPPVIAFYGTRPPRAAAHLAEQRREEAISAVEQRKARDQARQVDEQPTEQSQQALPPAPNLDLYRRLGELPAPEPRIDLVA